MHSSADTDSNRSLEQRFEALEKNYERHGYNLAYRLCRNHDDAQDIYAESKLRAWNNFRGLKHAITYPAWRNRITVNAFINLCRHRTRHPETSLEALEDNTHWVAAIEHKDPFRVTADRLTKQAIARIIEGLPDGFRDIVSLDYYAGSSYEEISRTLGIAIGTVKSRLNRARLTLKKRLTPLLDALDKGSLPQTGDTNMPTVKCSTRAALVAISMQARFRHGGKPFVGDSDVAKFLGITVDDAAKVVYELEHGAVATRGPKGMILPGIVHEVEIVGASDTLVLPHDVKIEPNNAFSLNETANVITPGDMEGFMTSWRAKAAAASSSNGGSPSRTPATPSRRVIHGEDTGGSLGLTDRAIVNTRVRNEDNAVDATLEGVGTIDTTSLLLEDAEFPTADSGTPVGPPEPPPAKSDLRARTGARALVLSLLADATFYSDLAKDTNGAIAVADVVKKIESGLSVEGISLNRPKIFLTIKELGLLGVYAPEKKGRHSYITVSNLGLIAVKTKGSRRAATKGKTIKKTYKKRVFKKTGAALVFDGLMRTPGWWHQLVGTIPATAMPEEGRYWRTPLIRAIKASDPSLNAISDYRVGRWLDEAADKGYVIRIESDVAAVTFQIPAQSENGAPAPGMPSAPNQVLADMGAVAPMSSAAPATVTPLAPTSIGFNPLATIEFTGAAMTKTAETLRWVAEITKAPDAETAKAALESRVVALKSQIVEAAIELGRCENAVGMLETPTIAAFYCAETAEIQDIQT